MLLRIQQVLPALSRRINSRLSHLAMTGTTLGMGASVATDMSQAAMQDLLQPHPTGPSSTTPCSRLIRSWPLAAHSRSTQCISRWGPCIRACKGRVLGASPITQALAPKAIVCTSRSSTTMAAATSYSVATRPTQQVVVRDVVLTIRIRKPQSMRQT